MVFWQSLWEEGKDCNEACLLEGPFTLPVAGMMIIGSSSGSNYSSKRRGGSERRRRNRVTVLMTLIFIGHRAKV